MTTVGVTMQDTNFDKPKQINTFIQSQLRILKIESIDPVTATQWLVKEGLLLQMGTRPGSYLRSLCRKRLIAGAKKIGSKWKIIKT
jgi:hypothetical protein